MTRAPFIGANIRYIIAAGPKAGEPRLAFITGLNDTGKVSLTCLPDAASDRLGVTLSATQVALSESKEPGTWHWPTGTH